MMDDIKIEDFSVDPDVIGQMLADEAKQKRRTNRYIGVSLGFVSDVCILTEGRAALAVALLIYRRVHVCGSRTVTLPADELTALDIGRTRKREALIQLRRARLIEVKNARGCSARITLLWREGNRF
jgi:hypothetical protein